MCTLVLAAGLFPDHPLVAVANRDEMLGRASKPPFAWDGFFAPKDEVAGGTWLGLNAHGVFVGITNRHSGMRDPSRVSRGAIVIEALRGTSAAAVHDAMSRLDPSRHNGFHLVYADRRDVLATVSDGEYMVQLTLGSGLHVVTERSFGAGDDRRREGRVNRKWSELTAGGFDEASLTLLLTEHDPEDPLGSTCIHLDAVGYGTRSAMVLDVAKEPRESRMLWAEGPPCKTVFEPARVAFDAKTG